MAIQYIEAVSIDGKGNNPLKTLFNGYIYKLNYQISMGDGKSKVSASLISEDGTYSINQSDLSFTRVYKIKIGSSISLNAVLTTYELVVESNSKILNLEFSDTSTNLDRYFVGLYKRQGITATDGSTKSIGNIIIVGREVHPCDPNYTGQIQSIPDLTDDCHPCRNTATQTAALQEVDCQEMNLWTIFPVNYNFDELITELQKYFNIDNNIQDPNPKYRNTYTGTVREVLQKWCADFGWIFYYENDTIKFLDLRTTIQVSTNLTDYCPNLEGYKEKYTIEGTVARIVNTYYERPGASRVYNCLDALYFSLLPYTSNTGGISDELKIVNIDTNAAGLIQYSEELRDLYYYYNYYNMRNDAAYSPGKELTNIGLTILSYPILLGGDNGSGEGPGLGNVSLQPSLGLNPPANFPLDPDPTSNISFLDFTPPTAALANVQAQIKANPAYLMCFQLLTAEQQWFVADALVKNPDDCFFFVGFYDAEEDRQHKEQERSFGSDFMGKYYIMQPDLTNPIQNNFFEDYAFFLDNICNILIRANDEKIKYEALNEGGGASFSFYNNPGLDATGNADTISKLPFAEWLQILRQSDDAQQQGSRSRMFKLAVVKKEGQLFYPSPSTKYSDEDVENGLVKDAIKNQELIALTQKHATIRVLETHNDIGEFIPRKVTALLGQPIDDNLNQTNVFIFIGRAVGQNDFQINKAIAVNTSNTVGFPFDGKPIATKYEDEFDLIGRVYYRYPDIRCKQIGNTSNICNSINFQTPEATYSYYEPTNTNYGVAIEKQKEIKYYPDKLQDALMDQTSIGNDVAKIDVLTKDISDSTISIFFNSQNTCRYDLSKIKQFHEIFAQNLDYNFNQPIVSKTFTVGGIDINDTPLIGDGLIEVDINGDEKGGIQTTYTLGTRLMMPMADQVLHNLYQESSQALASNQGFGLPLNRNSSNSAPGDL